MRRLVVVIALGGCGFHITAPGEGQGDDVMPANQRMHTDTSTEDFANPIERFDVSLPDRGVIEPDAFALDVLQQEGYATPHLLQTDTVPWGKLEALLTADRRTGVALTGVLDSDFPAGTPWGLGLTGIMDNFTIVYRGEIHLRAGITTLELSSDGPSLLEIATAPDGTFGHRMYARTSAPALAPRLDVDAPADGWYPIHAAITDTTGGAFIRLKEVAGSVATTLPASQYRTRVTDVNGIVMQAFDDVSLVDWSEEAMHIDALSFDYGNNDPPNNFSLNGDSFALRLVGQILVEEPGMYTFGGKADDRYRVWVGRDVVSSLRWPGLPDSSTPIDLTAGWHDFIADYADSGGPAGFKIAITAAPPNVALGDIEAKRLRPVTRFGRLTAAHLIGSTLGISQTARAGFTFPAFVPPVPPGATVDAIDIGYAFQHSAPAEVTIGLQWSNDADPLRINDPNTPTLDYFGGRTVFAGKLIAAPAPGWKLIALDNVSNGATGTFSSPTLAVAYRHPVGPISHAAVFASRPRPTTGALELVAVRVLGDLPTGSSATVEVRSCSAEDACAGPWLPAGPDMDPVPGDDFVQYRLSIASDGQALPSIDKVEIVYTIEL